MQGTPARAQYNLPERIHAFYRGDGAMTAATPIEAYRSYRGLPTLAGLFQRIMFSGMLAP